MGEGLVRESEAVAQARRELGAELAAYRRAAGYTQTAFAKLTEYSRSTVANVETGRQRVPRDFWERADSISRTGGVLASRHDEVEAMTRRERRAIARSISAARKVGAALNRQADPADRDAVPLSVPGQGTAPASGEPGVPPGEFHDVMRLRSMRLRLKSIDNAHGGGAALPMATWYFENEISPLLDGRGHPISRNLIEVVAEFHCDVGWAAYDSGEQEQAIDHFRSALRFAHAAGSRMLRGRILAAMSHQAIYLGHVRQAIDFAEAARAATRRLATPRAIAMLAAMEACAYAAAGDARRSEHALGDAEAALTSIDHGEPEPDWLDFDEGGYWGHAARACRDLGQLQKAEQYAEKSVGLCLAEHSRTRAQRNAIQATAHLRMKEVDAAAAAGLQVVNDAWNLHSGHVFGEVAQLIAAITPFGAPEARELVEQGRELLVARAPSVLPDR